MATSSEQRVRKKEWERERERAEFAASLISLGLLFVLPMQLSLLLQFPFVPKTSLRLCSCSPKV